MVLTFAVVALPLAPAASHATVTVGRVVGISNDDTVTALSAGK